MPVCVRVCRAMYGLLQLLPQSDAFRTLQARLHAAPTAALLALAPAMQPPGAPNYFYTCLSPLPLLSPMPHRPADPSPPSPHPTPPGVSLSHKLQCVGHLLKDSSRGN